MGHQPPLFPRNSNPIDSQAVEIGVRTSISTLCALCPGSKNVFRHCPSFHASCLKPFTQGLLCIGHPWTSKVLSKGDPGLSVMVLEHDGVRAGAANQNQVAGEDVKYKQV